MTDKRTDTIGSFRIPPRLKEKILRSATKNVRTLTEQIIYDLSLAEHIQDFSPEKDLMLNFFNLEGKKSEEE